jgi:hypothetical protein
MLIHVFRMADNQIQNCVGPTYLVIILDFGRRHRHRPPRTHNRRLV